MIAIVDYGMGNLRSVQKGLQKVGGNAEIVSRPEAIADADSVVLPGVGAFADAIERIRSTGLDVALLESITQGKPFLGICLGYQLLFDTSFENGQYDGLGIFSGNVVRFDFTGLKDNTGLKIPHMGWNQINPVPTCPLFESIPDNSYVYFVHSYHPDSTDNKVIAATTDYGYTFPSAVHRDNIYAVQFHPEKSQKIGLQMLKNFVEL